MRGAPLERLHGTAPLAFSPRSPLLAALSTDALTLWDATDPVHPKRLGSLKLAENQSYSLAFSPDGRTLAAGGENGRLRLWDLSVSSAPRPLYDRKVARAHLMAVAFNRDGRFLAPQRSLRRGRRRQGAPGRGAAVGRPRPGPPALLTPRRPTR
ncbi:hypothetical protein GCM10023238_35850 [Streptomyces heliomycini]